MADSNSNVVSEILKADRLVKRFGDITAVNKLSLDIRRGEILALLGPNGAGKTVTISILCGLLKPDSGHVFLNGKPLDPSNRGSIGLCPQSIVVWPKQTCREQLVFIGEMYGLPHNFCRQHAEELMEVFHLTEKRDKLAGTLSGGMQRRLNLALALMHNPRLLVLDEPEAGLDPQSRVLVREYVRRWAGSIERSVILTTHNMDEADRMADRVAIIDHGSLLVLDTPDILKRNVGAGDVLEIELSDNNELAQKACQDIKSIIDNVALQNNYLIVRALRAIELLPVIIQKIQERGITTRNVRLRGNTLEDVFITLTGRRLRE
jgi:ABC-2 type transport system ATP-binding protein